MAENLDKLFKDMKGGEWQPLYLFKPATVRELFLIVSDLQEELSVLDYPAIKKFQALLELHVTKAHLYKNRNQVEFVLNVTNAILNVNDILDWLYKNRKSHKEGL